MYYYEVGLSAARHWDSGAFTYMHPEPLKKNTLVWVPFGKDSKPGIVLKRTEKPLFATKPIDRVSDFMITKETEEFLQWYAGYYGDLSGRLFGQFIPSYLTKKIPIPEKDKEIAAKQHLSELSRAQAGVLAKIFSSEKPTVLHGVTGAGKTRIYLHAAEKMLKENKNVLLLYPEIALTPQLFNEIENHMPVVAFHSGLSDSERSKLWYKIGTSTKPSVIIGPRSSLFLPHQNLGLIIIDEAHEQSYKQDSDIHYNAIYTAAGLAKQHSAKLLLGSATPPITETEQILLSGGELVCLHEKAIETIGTSIEIIDKKLKNNFKKHPLLSDALLDKMRVELGKKRQIMLFLNRRGTAKSVLCSSATCDWQATCPNCELSLTYHHDVHLLRCHTCGFSQKMPQNCPVCHSEVQLKSFGSKAVVEDVQKIFPHARIARFDSDNNEAESFHVNYDAILRGEIDILVGTQQLIKGLDLPNLSVVGIINADLSLNFPDFSSEERTFQIVTQTIGRVDRGHQQASVIIQTFQKDSPIINHAKTGDWHSFRDKELSSRKDHLFPPYSYFAKLQFREKTYDSAFKKATKVKKQLENNKGLKVSGPFDSFYLKRANYFYLQLICSSKKRNILLSSIAAISPKPIVDIDPMTLL